MTELFKPLDPSFQFPEHGSLASSSYWTDAWMRLKKDRMAMIGLYMLIGLFLLAIVGPWISPYTYYEQQLYLKNTPPCAQFWFGSD
ncbi:MAG TPA: hypothetical protein VIJ46_04255, partial [Rhabdochlamydiaceae bacterium]